MKFKLIVFLFTPILLLQPLQAENDEYLQALRKTISAVNASVDATVKSVQDAIENDQADPPEVEVQLDPEISHAAFTTGVRDNVPVDDLLELEQSRKRLFFFAEILGMVNKNLDIHWYYENQEIAVETIVPKQQRWPGISRMALQDRQGNWAVEVVDDSDTVLLRREIAYLPK